MANTNQPEKMPQAGQRQQGQRQQEQQPQAGQGQQDLGGRKNNEETGEPVQLPEDVEQGQQPKRGGQQK